jgi:hypothetical protein
MGRCKEGTHNFRANCQGLTILDAIFDYDRWPSQKDKSARFERF